MIYYNRTEVSEGTDVNKAIQSKNCDICCYRYFLDKEFRFQSYVCSGCHVFLMMSINLDDTAILNIKRSNSGVLLTELAKGSCKFK